MLVIAVFRFLSLSILSTHFLCFIVFSITPGFLFQSADLTHNASIKNSLLVRRVSSIAIQADFSSFTISCILVSSKSSIALTLVTIDWNSLLSIKRSIFLIQSLYFSNSSLVIFLPNFSSTYS
jgi:hypothetical protein